MNDTPINPTPLGSTEPVPAPTPIEPTPAPTVEVPAPEPTPVEPTPVAQPTPAITSTPESAATPAPVISSAPAPTAAPAEQPKKKSSTLKIILIVVGILAFFVLAPIVFAIVMFVKNAIMDPLPTTPVFVKDDETSIRKELKENYDGLSIDKDEDHPIKCRTFTNSSGKEFTIYGERASDCPKASVFADQYDQSQ